MTNEIQKTEEQIGQLIKKLGQLRKAAAPTPVKNYTFQSLTGKVSLLELFGDKEILFAIHNMGQGCRYCTLWADGMNSFLPHLEDRFSVALLSKDSPEQQRRFANSRHWRFRMASHGGNEYATDHTTSPGQKNAPGIVCYTRKGDQIFKKNATGFGPGDLYCTQWHILSLAGYDDENWTPQYNYWKRPETMDDGGQNLV